MGQQHDHGHSHEPQSHHHSHDHGHNESSHSRVSSAFRWSIALNSGLTALQLAIGLGFGSLALIGDALHNLGDVVGLSLGWGADQLSRRPARGRFTYGFGRSTQMVSLVNGLLIFAAGAVVVVEAIQRLFNPVPLIAGPVAWAAAAGIVINLLSARLFGHDHHHDLNQRAAVLHLLTDAAVSVAVLVSALVVGATGWFWLDALTAIGVGAAVILSALGLLREALALNLDAAPRHVDLIEVEQALASLPAVIEIEELHVWGLSTALTAHVVIDPDRLQGEGLSRDQLLAQARHRLEAFGICKSTLQLETAAQPDAPTCSGKGKPTKLLLVEDDPTLQVAMQRLLRQWGYGLELAGTGSKAMGWLEQERFDLVLLDLGLPDTDGLTLCRQLRRLPRHQPLVLMLTARDGRRDKLLGYEGGADDYVVKPFDPELLRVRLAALLRRADRLLQGQLCWGPLALQSGQSVALVQGHPLELTNKEALLLEQLLRARGASCRKSELLHACGDGRRIVGEDALRAHMCNLRQKLTAAGCDPNLIETVYGLGYRLHTSVAA